VVLRLVAITLFDLPQAVILPGLDVVRIGLERALVPDLRDLVVAELAIGIADQVGDGGAVVPAERLELRDCRGIVVAVVDRGVGGAITVANAVCSMPGRASLDFFFFLSGGGGSLSGAA
jgi:hypothetical protein